MGTPNIPVLQILRARSALWTPPRVLAEQANVALDECWKAIDGLREFGFQVDDCPQRGLRYAGPSQRLCPDLIEHELRTRLIASRLHIYETCQSTNDLARALAANPDAHGAVFLAEHQTAGRGRQGAPWFCPPRRGILASILLTGPRQPDRNLLVSLGATATAVTVRETSGLDARIKWPNDVRVERIKIAGVLVESDDHAAVLGIGLNVNTRQDEFPPELRSAAGSLRSLAGREFDRNQMVVDLLNRLDLYCHWVMAGESDRVWDRWSSLADFAGCRALADVSGRKLWGRIVDFSPHVGFIFNADNGGPCEIHPSRILEIRY